MKIVLKSRMRKQTGCRKTKCQSSYLGSANRFRNKQTRREQDVTSGRTKCQLPKCRRFLKQIIDHTRALFDIIVLLQYNYKWSIKFDYKSVDGV